MVNHCCYFNWLPIRYALIDAPLIDDPLPMVGKCKLVDVMRKKTHLATIYNSFHLLGIIIILTASSLFTLRISNRQSVLSL